MHLNKDNIFFISDTHFWHKNVIKFDNRPFKSVEEMNEALILNWNNVVKKDNIVFFLGDFAFAGITKTKEIADRLNGIIHVITGNHDNTKLLAKTGRFVSIEGYKEIWIEGTLICMSHYPMIVWNSHHRGSIHLHGHSHGSLIPTEFGKTYYKRKVIDVGCNNINYTPISYLDICKIMNEKAIITIDNHK